MSFETFVARRYLKIRHQGRLVPLITILATVGVAVGVMVLMVVIAVMTGFQSELKKRMLGIEAHVRILRYDGWISDNGLLIEKLRHIPEVQSAAPFVYAQGMIRSASGLLNIVLYGIAPQQNELQIGALTGRDLHRVLTSDGGINLVLGSVLADKLKVKVGDDVMVTVAGSRQSSTRWLPDMRRLSVVEVFDTGMHQYDGTIGFVRIDQLQQIIGLPSQVTGIDVRVKDVDTVGQVSRIIADSLGDQYWVNDWQHMHRNLFSMLFFQKVTMYIILTLIILVAAFNIATALVMMVKEKTRDIAIMKAMGATKSSIQRIFLSKGMIIGLVGILIGTISAAMICFLLSRYQFINLPGDIYFLTTLPVKVQVSDIVVIVMGTLIICFFASLYPARKASELDAVVGIRYG